MKTTVILCMAMVGLTTGCATFPAARTQTCINNMRILDSATEQTALAYDLKSGEVAPRDNISDYIKGGIDSLRCPASGVYEVGTVGADPRCSIHGTLTEATRAYIQKR